MLWLLLCGLAPATLHAQATPAPSEPPAIGNILEVSRRLSEHYPAELRAQGVGGTVQLRTFIDGDGKPDSTYIAASSGIAPLDVAAMSALRLARFAAPSLEDGAAGRWFDLPVYVDADPEDADVAPALVDRAAVDAALLAAIPRDLLRRRIHAPVVLLLEVAEDGSVVHAEAPVRGCLPSAAPAAISAAQQFRFQATEPGTGLRRFPATVAFAGDTVHLRLAGDAFPRPRPAPPRESSGGRTARPEVRNVAAVQSAMTRQYPAHLRQAGIAGEVGLRLFVDERGRVAGMGIDRSSGHCELDLAALRVGENMAFTPALSDGQRVSVWVDLPLRFGSSF